MELLVHVSQVILNLFEAISLKVQQMYDGPNRSHSLHVIAAIHPAQMAMEHLLRVRFHVTLSKRIKLSDVSTSYAPDGGDSLSLVDLVHRVTRYRDPGPVLECVSSSSAKHCDVDEENGRCHYPGAPVNDSIDVHCCNCAVHWCEVVHQKQKLVCSWISRERHAFFQCILVLFPSVCM